MNKVLKDLPFAIAYLDDIIIYSRTTGPSPNGFPQTRECQAAKEIKYLGHILSTTGIKPLPSKTEVIRVMQPPRNEKQVQAFLGLVGYYPKINKHFAHIEKLLMSLMQQGAKFAWMLTHWKAFVTLKGALLQAPILQYPDPSKCYIVCKYASDDACGAQLSQEHNGQEFSVTFLSYMFTDQCKWSTPKQEAYGVYYTITKWNYCL